MIAILLGFALFLGMMCIGTVLGKGLDFCARLERELRK